MKLCVNKICQSSSAGDFVAKYDADIQFIDDSNAVEVTIIEVKPPGASERAIEAAREAIARGAEKALMHRGLGACILVNWTVILVVDFKPSKYEMLTTEEVQRIISEI